MVRLLTGFVLGMVATVLLGAAGVYTYFKRGMAPVATSASPMPFEKRLARMALHARVEREMPDKAPIPADEGNLAAGARVYVQHCAVCHGLPGSQPTAIAVGEFPKPPHLFRGKGVTDDPAGETYWKVANGIRLTGMPGFQKSLSTDQMWQVSLLLANADKLPASVGAALAPGSEPGKDGANVALPVQ
jgi:thiosulfate dehydrogenase